MIFYFSGTGNSAWAARQLARLTGDKAYDITDLKELPEMEHAEQTGFVFPVYAWGAPEVMADFARKLPASKGFTFGVCTCGGDAGLTMKQFSKLYPLHSSYSLLMPNNYILGSDTDDESEILQKIAAARVELEQMAQEIRRREKVYRVHEGALAGTKSPLSGNHLEAYMEQKRVTILGSTGLPEARSLSLPRTAATGAASAPGTVRHLPFPSGTENRCGQHDASSACAASTNVPGRPSNMESPRPDGAAIPSGRICPRMNSEVVGA